MPFRSVSLCLQKHIGERCRRNDGEREVEMVVLLFLLSGHGSCIGSEWVKLDVASELSLFSRP